ncbi:MAG: phosphonate transporter, periplasmic phosphonate-binding protein [Cyanobacteria bacterium RYN_339]|nr:phosphonate transporter, periplasmic phosphonate-binding protein [Cyanobacteria bacterium RYN_339]
MGASRGAAQPRPLTIGFAPFENQAEVLRKARPVVDVLTKALNRPVRPFVAGDYPAIVEALKGGKLDVAFLSPAAMIMAEKVAGARVLLKSVYKGRSAYYSAIITRTDSPYKTLADLKGHTFAFVDPGSTSGGVYPKLMLMKAGLNPDHDFSHLIYAGGHDAAVLAVLNHKVDAASTFANDNHGDDVPWKHILGKDADKIRAIAYSQPIPNGAIAVSKSLDAETTAKVRQTFLDLGKSVEGRAHLSRFYLIESFAPATSADYDPVREAFARVGLRVK